MTNINSKTREALKLIPSVDSIILDLYEKFKISFHYSIVKNIVKKEIKSLKSEILDGIVINNIKQTLYKKISDKIQKYSNNSLRSVINGTGIVLHTGLGRAPISRKVLTETFNNIYPYSNLEFNIDDNSRVLIGFVL